MQYTKRCNMMLLQQ